MPHSIRKVCPLVPVKTVASDAGQEMAVGVAACDEEVVDEEVVDEVVDEEVVDEEVVDEEIVDEEIVDEVAVEDVALDDVTVEEKSWLQTKKRSMRA